MKVKKAINKRNDFSNNKVVKKVKKTKERKNIKKCDKEVKSSLLQSCKDIDDNELELMDEQSIEDGGITEKGAPLPAWVDEEDSIALPVTFEDNSRKTPKWAECSTESAAVVEVKKLLSINITENLLPNTLGFKVTRGFLSNTKGTVSHFTFNSDTPLVLVCRKEKSSASCDLFQVDGENNYLIQTIKFEKFPVTKAAFIDLKRFVVISDSHSYFYTYNLATGTRKKFFTQDQKKATTKLTKVVISPNREKMVLLTDGLKIHVYYAEDVSKVTTLLLQFKANDAVFHVTSGHLYAYCNNGFVYIYDLEKMACINRFYDNGSIEGTCIAMAPNSKYIACGSSSGIVNLYDISKMESVNPNPIKVFKKILTPITSLTFNSTSEILFMSSSATLGAAKMAHIHSLQTFRNYPNLQDAAPQPIYAAEFSPRSAYLALVKGSKIQLLRLKHYSAY